MHRPISATLAILVAAALAPGAALAQGDAAKGKESYEQLCASCHGASGKGDGAAAAALDPKPRDLTDKAYMGPLSDDHVAKVIKEGGPAAGKSPLMPPWGGALSDEQIRDVVAYLRTLAK